MSHKQKAVLALTFVIESCSAALNAFSANEGPQAQHAMDFVVLRTDFLSILAIIYAATTKVALSLNPSKPEFKAALVPLKDSSNNVAALVHSIRLIRLREGITISKEYEDVAINVITALQALSQTLSSEISSASGEDYLIRVGEVHELIDRARKAGGLSTDNREAVKRSWIRDHEALADAYEELQEICKPDEGSDQTNGDELDDGWDELGIDSKQKISGVELDRAEKVQSLIKLVVLLHKRITKDFLSSEERKIDNASLDKLATMSLDLPALFDELVSSMYSPHHPEDVAIHLNALLNAMKHLKSILLPNQRKTLDEQLEFMALSSNDKNDKWLVTCFEQLDRFADKVSGTLL